MFESKTERTKQLLVRYIRDSKMKRGDKLPPQNQLRKLFNSGAVTVSSAINTLKKDGVLEVKDKVGVFVIDPYADGHTGRVIGITMLSIGDNLYYSCLLTCIQMLLVENGCKVRLFRTYKEINTERILFDIDDFPGLRRSLEGEEIQGLIHFDDFTKEALDFIKNKNIPLIFAGSQGGITNNGVFFDHQGILRAAYKKVKENGALRPALICQTSIRKCLDNIFTEIGGNVEYIFSQKSANQCVELAKNLLNIPKEKRPDWLIFLDDFQALALLSTLSCSLPPEEMPGAVVMCNLPSQFYYPVRQIILFDSNLEEFSKIVVELLIEAMTSGQLETGKVLYLPSEYKK